MDGQVTWLGWLSVAKDCSTLIAAAFGVYVAWKGLRTWQRQLKGSSQFDVAKRLMLKVYQIRQDIEFCRAPFRDLTIFTHYEDGKPIPEIEQQRYSSNKEMWSRFNPIAKTLNEIEFILYESKIILNEDVNEIFKPIKDVCYLLRNSMDEYTEDYVQNDRSYQDNEGRDRYRELRRIIYSLKNDEIQTNVNVAVAKMEEFIMPYIHA